MKKRLSFICVFLLLLAGIGLLLYPSVSDYWNAQHQSGSIVRYIQTVADMEGEEQSSIIRDAAAYNAALTASGISFCLSKQEKAEYYATMNIDDTGILGFIDIDRIDCHLPIYHGCAESVLRVAIGHMEGSSFPIGGAGTHCLLIGHRGLSSARLFTDLDQLEPGDTFVIRTLDEALVYEIDQVRLIDPDDVSMLCIDPNRDQCSLITCAPYGLNTHRLLVQGQRQVDTAAKPLKVGESRRIRIRSQANVIVLSLSALLFAIPLLVVCLIWFLIDTHMQEKRNRMRKRLGLP